MGERGDLNVLVAVRVRPDPGMADMACAEATGRQVLLSAPSMEQIRALRLRLRRRGQSGQDSRLLTRTNSAVFQKDLTFRYDQVYAGDTSQEQIYEELGKNILKNCLDGFNATLFAYGQTGSGKTHTMMGPSINAAPVDRGIIPRLCADLFLETEKLVQESEEDVAAFVRAYKLSQDRPPSSANSAQGDDDVAGDESGRDAEKKLREDEDEAFEVDDDGVRHRRVTAAPLQRMPRVRYAVQVSMVEIYKERIRDLLNPSHALHQTTGLSLREHPDVGWFIPELTRLDVTADSQIAEVIAYGSENRTIAQTKMNDTSSRAHTIVQLRVIRTEEYLNKAGTNVLYATDRSSLVNLVDLAGSEQMATSVGDYKRKIRNFEQREKELIAINVSLSALGMVITKLARMFDGDASVSHIPYRDSKLTKLLMDSLGGNSRTVMVATISPNPLYYDQTVSTCRYAHRVKSIKNRPIVNQDPKEKIIADLRRRIQELLEKQQTVGHLVHADTQTLEELKGLSVRMTHDMELLSKQHRAEVTHHLSQHTYLRRRNTILGKKLDALKSREKDAQREAQMREREAAEAARLLLVERNTRETNASKYERALQDLNASNEELRRLLEEALRENRRLRTERSAYEARVRQWRNAQKRARSAVKAKQDSVESGLSEITSFVKRLDKVVMAMYDDDVNRDDDSDSSDSSEEDAAADDDDRTVRDARERSASSSSSSSSSSGDTSAPEVTSKTILVPSRRLLRRRRRSAASPQASPIRGATSYSSAISTTTTATRRPLSDDDNDDSSSSNTSSGDDDDSESSDSDDGNMLGLPPKRRPPARSNKPNRVTTAEKRRRRILALSDDEEVLDLEGATSGSQSSFSSENGSDLE